MSSVLQLIRQCLDSCSEKRPTFDQVKRIVVRMHPVRESPVDNMMRMVGVKFFCDDMAITLGWFTRWRSTLNTWRC